jgi:hypothetical protein
MAPFFRRSMALFGFLGHNSGAVGVEVVGKRNSAHTCRRVSVVADHDGQRIPIMPAVIMAQALLSNDSDYQGLVPLDGWLSQDQLQAQCDRRGYRLVVEKEQECCE